MPHAALSKFWDSVCASAQTMVIMAASVGTPRVLQGNLPTLSVVSGSSSTDTAPLAAQPATRGSVYDKTRLCSSSPRPAAARQSFQASGPSTSSSQTSSATTTAGESISGTEKGQGNGGWSKTGTLLLLIL